jgi:thiol-disulfide isomerase/thioredoxin
LFLFLACAYSWPALALDIGAVWPKEAVSQKLKNVDEREVTIEGVKGEKGTLIIFYCNHCPYVKAWQDRIVMLGNRYAAKGIGVIAVNSNDPVKYPDDRFEKMQAKAKEKGFQFSYAVDGTSMVAKQFGATRTPEAYLFNASNELFYHGAIDDNAEEPLKVQKRYLEDALEALLKGKAFQPAETKSVGCTIKFR